MVIYITEQGTVVGKRGERLTIKNEGAVIQEIHVKMIDRIIIFGRSMLTPAAIETVLKNGIPVAFLSMRGKLKGILESVHAPDVSLRFRQFLLVANREYSIELAKKFVRGKIRNQRRVLQRLKRYRPEISVDEEIEELKFLAHHVPRIKGFSSLRGIEGRASYFYFSSIKKLIPEPFRFEARIRRPPGDPVNSLLSFGYSLLTLELFGYLRMHGFDPYLGFFHRLRFNRPALALDLVEEFRHAIVDLLVFDILSHRKLSPDDFWGDDSSGWFLKKRGRAVFFKSYEQRLKTKLTYHDGQRYTLRKIMELQALRLKKTLQNESVEYVPFMLP